MRATAAIRLIALELCCRLFTRRMNPQPVRLIALDEAESQPAAVQSMRGAMAVAPRAKQAARSACRVAGLS